MDLNYAKKVLVEFQKKHEDYLEEAANYAAWKSLPFWKRWFTTVASPRRDYLYESYVIVYRGNLLIELRMFFSRENKNITLAINENNHGYKVDLNGEISYYLGRINPSISSKAASLLESIRKELAPLYVE